MSEMRRAARSLVESRTERFRSRHDAGESHRRLAAALETLRSRRAVRFAHAWEEEEGRPVLVATYSPAPKTQRFMSALSLGMALLVAASAWAMLSPEASRSITYLLPIITVLVILGAPLLILAMASNRAAEEAIIGKALRVALAVEEER
ncbi:MAG: hypothetical protein ABIR73_04585 [Usitatibacter sp.]